MDILFLNWFGSGSEIFMNIWVLGPTKTHIHDPTDYIFSRQKYIYTDPIKKCFSFLRGV